MISEGINIATRIQYHIFIAYRWGNLFSCKNIYVPKDIRRGFLMGS